MERTKERQQQIDKMVAFVEKRSAELKADKTRVPLKSKPISKPKKLSIEVFSFFDNKE